MLTLLPAMEGGASGHREAWSGTPTGHHQLSGVRTAGCRAAASWDVQFPVLFPPAPLIMAEFQLSALTGPARV